MSLTNNRNADTMWKLFFDFTNQIHLLLINKEQIDKTDIKDLETLSERCRLLVKKGSSIKLITRKTKFENEEALLNIILSCLGQKTKQIKEYYNETQQLIPFKPAQLDVYMWINKNQSKLKQIF